jgi:hypothetical protein
LNGTFGERLRLEQEFISFASVVAAARVISNADLVDELTEAENPPVIELILGRTDATHSLRDPPFLASFGSDPDLAERSEEILRAKFDR